MNEESFGTGALDQPRQVIDLAYAPSGDGLQQSSERTHLRNDEQGAASTHPDGFHLESLQQRFAQTLRLGISAKPPAYIDSEDDDVLVDTCKHGRMVPPPLPHRAKVNLMFRFEKNTAYSCLREDEVHQIAFNASPESLVAVLQAACTRVCQDQYADLLGELLRIGLDLDMNAFISFGDGRDDFINKDQLGRFRWRCIADLFPISIDSSRDFEIPIKIKVSVVNKLEPLPSPASIDIWKQHRLGWCEGIGNRNFGEDAAYGTADNPKMRGKVAFGNRLRDLVAKKPKGYDWRADSPISMARLFDSESERQWWIDIWVMPQSKGLGTYRRLAKKGGAGKNLAAFLDPAMVEEGDRKLWVEAHLLGPKKEDGF
ncbi:uncharacterized protein MYCFIDRAFT_81896 [Pseudocercospora fijiensis CIRAD86]|uniref:Uncharacterized protein n=1 Tax=Pseudocercospora fijiensis (strain CIRAD86) TaxID=383855 RepID=M3A493_PSEFD|nr:uncharacterized protein MYCFIDRAFT_81896 [Pseudocercospora fijiensis CIRAD86]EME85929.1 hypothetical protein MYCFIDRAFT_81896 [Pseudocercospora fijiensis CIRAD86]